MPTIARRRDAENRRHRHRRPAGSGAALHDVSGRHRRPEPAPASRRNGLTRIAGQAGARRPGRVRPRARAAAPRAVSERGGLGHRHGFERERRRRSIDHLFEITERGQIGLEPGQPRQNHRPANAGTPSSKLRDRGHRRGFGHEADAGRPITYSRSPSLGGSASIRAGPHGITQPANPGTPLQNSAAAATSVASSASAEREAEAGRSITYSRSPSAGKSASSRASPCGIT